MTDSEKLDYILTELQSVKEDIRDLKGDVRDLKVDVRDLKYKVDKIDLTIENEIRVNIQRIAEGHHDLSRKLDECIKLSSEVKSKQEIQDIYINMHENKLKALAL